MGFYPEKFKIINYFYTENTALKIVNDNVKNIIYNSKALNSTEFQRKINFTYSLPVGWKKYMELLPNGNSNR